MIGEEAVVGTTREGQTVNTSTETPVFDLQRHHARVSVPTSMDLRDLARKLQIFPLKLIVTNGIQRLLLAMRNPKDLDAIHQVEMKTGFSVLPVKADACDVQWLIQKHYYGRPLTPTPSLRPRETAHELFESLCKPQPDFTFKALGESSYDERLNPRP